jgi:hypothetical protein
MKTKSAFVAASAMALFALTAGAPPTFAATTHNLTCKTGMEARRVMEKGKHVWRCEPISHHQATQPQGGMAPSAPQGGTSY